MHQILLVRNDPLICNRGLWVVEQQLICDRSRDISPSCQECRRHGNASKPAPCLLFQRKGGGGSRLPNFEIEFEFLCALFGSGCGGIQCKWNVGNCRLLLDRVSWFHEPKFATAEARTSTMSAKFSQANASDTDLSFSELSTDFYN